MSAQLEKVLFSNLGHFRREIDEFVLPRLSDVLQKSTIAPDSSVIYRVRSDKVSGSLIEQIIFDTYFLRADGFQKV